MKIEIPDCYFNAEERKNTPQRVQRFWDEWLNKSHDFQFTTFKNPGYDQMISEVQIPLYSMCSHHLLPFIGFAHIAYVPNKKICGLSKLARVVDKFAHCPQIQERLTQQIADYLEDRLNPKGVAVMIEAEHLCMSCRGVRKVGAKTITTALKGKFHTEKGVKEEFLSLVNSRRN